jgi:hypothetical protein
VNAVQRRNFVLLEEFGGGHVGRQHAFLDQLVGVVANGRMFYLKEKSKRYKA